MNRAERRRRAKEDEKLLLRGIDPEAQDARAIAALARLLDELLDQAKRERNIDPPVRYLHSRIEATTRGLAHVPVACKAGCSHCCYTWVSASAPEVLFVAKALRRKRDGAAAERIKAAHLATKDFDFFQRGQHPHPCPLLAHDLCSVYELRPRACRFAASADADICARSYHNLGNEDIPMPRLHLTGSSIYAIALAIALKHAQLPHHLYEFNGALARAIENDDAERRWLMGEDVFAGVRRDPNDVFEQSPAYSIYSQAFA